MNAPMNWLIGTIRVLLLAALTPGVVHAQDAAAPAGRTADESLLLWAGEAWTTGPPGQWRVEGEEVREPKDHMGGIVTLRNVGAPSLAYYRPVERVTDRAVIVCPGGGYHILAWDLEGTEVAEWLNGLGVHAFVLKYRLPRAGDKERHAAALEDAQRALSLVRAGAAERGIAPDRIGIMGFSAGGHLAALAADRGNERVYKPADAVDAVPCRADFAALIYPAYLVPDQNAPGTAGAVEPAAGATGLSPLFRVPAGMPPVFLAHAIDDPVPVANSTAYLLAMKARKVPAELHVYPDGGHGYGLRSPLSVKDWPARMAAWLQRLPTPARPAVPATPAAADGQ